MHETDGFVSAFVQPRDSAGDSMGHLSEMIEKARMERNGVQRFIARHYLFGIAERLGFHVLGDHFHEPIPNLRELARIYDPTPVEVPGHDLSVVQFESAHIRRLEAYGAEFDQVAASNEFDASNLYFRGADAVGYYALLRDVKPDAVVEVGQGHSTRVAVAALRRNAEEHGRAPLLVSIDPYSRLSTQSLRLGPVRFRLVSKAVQSLAPEELLRDCSERALLFVDSSHVYKYGSDVWYLVRRVYPNLPAGCYLHIHDITLPYPWPLDLFIRYKWFWNEQDILESFLAFNTAFEVVLPIYALLRDSEKVRVCTARVVPYLPRREIGYSFYLRRK
jgi:cephalosporin hydroxylase